jgi:hypothetical protein
MVRNPIILLETVDVPHDQPINISVLEFSKKDLLKISIGS